MKRKLKQCWSTIPITSPKRTITSRLKSLNMQKKPTTSDVGNPGPGLGQAQKCGEVNPLMGFQPSPLIGSGTSIQI